MSSRLPAAVLWDMDGTLVDTEPYWFESETELDLEARAPSEQRKGVQSRIVRDYLQELWAFAVHHSTGATARPEADPRVATLSRELEWMRSTRSCVA